MLKNSISLEQCIIHWNDLIDLVNPKKIKIINKGSDTGYQLINVLKDVANLDENFNSWIGILHGTFIGMSDNWFKDSEVSFPFFNNFFIHNEGDYQRLSKLFNSKDRFILIAHPFHYIINNYIKVNAPQPVGSVFFLPHELGDLPPCINIESVINRLKLLPKKYFPIDICLHPNGVNKKIVKIIKENNFGVVCAGSRHDPYFLHRFYWLCKRRKYSLNAEFGTSVLLSSLVGLENIKIDGLNIIRWWPSNAMGFQIIPEQHYRKLIKLFYEEKASSKEFVDLVFKLMGGEYFIGSNDLKKIFLNSKSKRFRFRDMQNKPNLSPYIYSLFYPYLRFLRNNFSALIRKLLYSHGKISPNFR